MFKINTDKLEHVRNVHKNILYKRKIAEKLENQHLLETKLFNGTRQAIFNIPITNALPIKAPECSKQTTIQRKRAVNETKLVVPFIHLYKIENRPERSHFTPSQINLEVEDDHVLQYIPYFNDDDNDDEFHNSLLEAYENKCHEPKDVSLCLDVIVDLVHALRNGTDGSTNINSPVTELNKADNSKSRLSNRKALSLFSEDEIFDYISLLYEGKEVQLKAKEIKELYESHITPKAAKETMPNIDETLGKFYNVDQALDTYTKLYCPMCLIYDCLLHPGYDVQKTIIENMTLNEDDSPCGFDCFLNLDYVNVNDYFPRNENNHESSKTSKKHLKIPENLIKNRPRLSMDDRTLLNVYMDTYKDNYCAITKLMNYEFKIHCCQVFIEAQDIKKMLGEKAAPFGRIKKDNQSKKPKCKHRKKTSVWKNFSAQKSDLRKSYVPCNHPGESCKNAEKCTCRVNETLCEKYCGCDENCHQRFPGCTCKGACQTSKCPCNLANRECDGDRCKCSADVLDLDELKCKNCSIQRGLGKHLLMGVSQVAGWGVFLNGTAEKNDLISEYCGELISHHDAEARGIVYDKTGVSFLFDLNKDVKTCDAKNIGNKIRFANHDHEDPNCYPRIMSVNGQHRIGIYAKRRIREQEELFFDYGTVKFNPAERALPRD